MFSYLLHQLLQLYVCVCIIWFLNQLYDHHQQGAVLLLHAGNCTMQQTYNEVFTDK